MGNRAVISVEGSEVGIYLHWNGGPESVNAFLAAAKALGVRDPVSDTSYFLARLAQIIGNFFGGTLSVGVDSVKRLDTDNGDNGHYIVGADFKVIQRKHVPKHAKPKEFSADYDASTFEAVMAANRDIFNKL